MGDELIVTFGDAQDFVDGLDPGRRKGLVIDEGSENGAERLTKTEDAEENCVHSLRLRGEKGTETGGTILRDQASVGQEGDEFIPGEIVGGGCQVGEIEGEAAGDQW